MKAKKGKPVKRPKARSAKKTAAKTTSRKPTSRAGAKPARAKAAPAKRRVVSVAAAEKYSQTGAPWWKAHL